jgi:hypothetical protein
MPTGRQPQPNEGLITAVRHLAETAARADGFTSVIPGFIPFAIARAKELAMAISPAR